MAGKGEWHTPLCELKHRELMNAKLEECKYVSTYTIMHIIIGICQFLLMVKLENVAKPRNELRKNLFSEHK